MLIHIIHIGYVGLLNLCNMIVYIQYTALILYVCITFTILFTSSLKSMDIKIVL